MPGGVQVVDPALNLVKGTNQNAPTNLFVALHTGDPGADGTANEVSTVGTGYARQTLTPATWSAILGTIAGGDRRVEYTALIQFLEATQNWGDISHLSFHTSSTGANLHSSGTLTTAKAVNTGSTANFPSGAAKIGGS